MAVEASYGNLCPPKLIGNRVFMGMNCVEGIGNGCGAVDPLSLTEIMLPVYGAGVCETVPTRIPVGVNSGSSLTYGGTPSRKRSRETVIENGDLDSLFSFNGEDLSLLFQLQRLEIDRLIAHHTEKMKAEIELRRRRISRWIEAEFEYKVMKKLEAKEEEIETIGKLNWALEERVKSLSVENQIWKQLAQTNEATANALRSNIQQVLSQVHVLPTDDGESSCGSNSHEKSDGFCRSCRRRESCVLLLPCRHLSLCTVCGSSQITCPVCNSIKSGSVHVNLYGL